MSCRVRRSALGLVVVLLAIPLVLAACGRSDDGGGNGPQTLEWRVDPDPPKRGPATVTIHLEDEDGEPRAGATLELEGNMNHAGMVPVFSDLSETEPGTYVSDGFTFTMGGDWILTVRGTLSDGSPFEETFPVDGVGG